MEIERIKLEQAKQANRKSPHSPLSRGSSGLHTPSGKIASGNTTTRSVGYYFDQLKKHIKANNNMNQYTITCTKFSCQVYNGKECIHEVAIDPQDSTSIRNLYLMFYASDYSIETFLVKRNNLDFADFNGFDVDGKRITTPPKCDERANVFAFAIDK